MDLTSDDRHNMQLDSDYIPSPIVNDRLSSGFHIPTTMNIAYVSDLVSSRTQYLMETCSFYQLLENEKLLLVLLDRDRVVIYLDRLPAINVAIRRDRHIKSLSREKLGEDVLFAFDEAQRSLAVCTSSKVYLRRLPKSASYDSLFSNSYSFTCSFSTRATGRFRHREARLISLPGIAKRSSLSFMRPSYVGTKKLSWWTPPHKPASFPLSRCNLGVIFLALVLYFR